MCTHVGDTLVVRRAARTGDTPTRATEVSGDDGQIDTGRRYLGGISVDIVVRSRQLVMGDRLVNQRCGVIGIRRWARTAGRIVNCGLANQLSGDASDRDDAVGLVRVEAGSPPGKPGTALGRGPCQSQVEDRPRDAI